MNSVIISTVCAFFAGIFGMLKRSRIYAIVDRLYHAFSLWWKQSCIMSFLRSDGNVKSETSMLYRIIRFPFAVIERITKGISGWLGDAVEKSIILNLVRDFMNNVLAVNTRFLGILMFTAGAVYMLLTMRISVIIIGMAGLGALMAAANLNLIDFLTGSRVVGFCLYAIGFSEINRKIYNGENVAKKHTLILAALAGCACGALATVSPVLALGLPVGITGLSVVMCVPIAGVFTAVAAAPFAPTMILALLCVLTFCAQVLKSVREQEFKWRVDGVGVGLGFFLLFLMISSLLSFNPVKSMMVWGMYLIFVGFYFVIINTVRTKAQLYYLLKMFVVLGFFVSMYGVLQYVFGWNVDNSWIDENMFEEATMRVYSTMENPNVLGEYLLLILPLSVVFMLDKKGSRLERIFYCGVFLVSALCMIFTQSRGCWLGLILSAAVFVSFYNGRLWGLMPLALIALPFVMPETMINRLLSVGNLADSSTSYRVFIWRGCFKMLKDFWIGGIGMGEGAFRMVYPIYSFNGIIAPHAHNTYLQLWVEGGIAAPVIFAAIMIVFLKKLASVFTKAADYSAEKLIPLAIGSGVMGFLLQGMFDYTFYNYRMMAMFFMAVAIGSAFSQLKEGADV